MSTTPAKGPRRVRVERNVYRRADGALEIIWRDGSGAQRCEVVKGGILAARRQRDTALAAKATGAAPKSNPRLRFNDAADRWLADHVTSLRTRTQESYTANVAHLRKRFGTSRLDHITADDFAVLVRELRAAGLAEWTIQGVLGAANRIYRHAARRLAWAGTNPVAELLPSERAKVSQTKRRGQFTLDQIQATIAAAPEGRWRTHFVVAALTGARVSEVLGLTWADVILEDLDDASIVYAMQVDRTGRRQPLKTADSTRVVSIPRPLAEILAQFKLANGLAGLDTSSAGFVFCTATGKALSQRNASRALRAAQKQAQHPDGRWMFPVLHERDEHNKPIPVPRGALPSMHSFRHAFASQALAAGESVDEVAFLLGHRDANVTRAIYVHEVNDARRRAMRRDRIAAEYGSVMSAADATPRDAAQADEHPDRLSARGKAS